MMGRQTGDQSQLFYLFNLERRIPSGNLLRRINPVVTRILFELRDKLATFSSDIGRPSIDPELMIRMLIVGYCYGIRSERRVSEEVDLHLAYRWFCRLDLDDQVPDHSTFSVNRHARSSGAGCVWRSQDSILGTIVPCLLGALSEEPDSIDEQIRERARKQIEERDEFGALQAALPTLSGSIATSASHGRGRSGQFGNS